MNAKFEEFIKSDGELIFNLAIYNRFSNVGASCYASVCGGFYQGVHQWSTHKIDGIIKVENEKYTGYTISFKCNIMGHFEQRVYIENNILQIEPKDWKHAKNLFNKYLKEDVLFNRGQEEERRSVARNMSY